MKWKSKERDRHLDTPAEANRDKHINFAALERGDPDPASNDINCNFRLPAIRNGRNKKGQIEIRPAKSNIL